MKEITQELVKDLFDYKDGELFWKKSPNCRIQIGKKAGSLNQNGYYKIKINYKLYYTHRLIFLYHNGYLSKYVDHIDGNKENNNINNLREVTQSQNLMNSKPNKNTSSKYKGVHWNKASQKWEVKIQINGKQKYLGLFKSEINAAKIYNKAAIKYYNEYAYLNEI